MTKESITINLRMVAAWVCVVGGIACLVWAAPLHPVSLSIAGICLGILGAGMGDMVVHS